MRLGSSIPKHAGSRGAAPVWGVNFFSSNFCLVMTECITNQMKFFSSIFFSKVFKFIRKMRNVLKRSKNRISDFSLFHFLSYGLFCIQYMVNFWSIFTITREKKIGFIFSFLIHFRIFLNYSDNKIKTAHLRGKKQKNLNITHNRSMK